MAQLCRRTPVALRMLRSMRYVNTIAFCNRCMMSPRTSAHGLVKLLNYGQMQSRMPRNSSTEAKLPPHKKVPLPALSPTMENGTIMSWQKKEGDRLDEGDLLAEIETDKATMGLETPDEGYLAKILVPEGSKNVPIGKLLCVIVENEEDVAAFKDYKPNESETTAAVAPPPPPMADTPLATAPPVKPTPPPLTSYTVKETSTTRSTTPSRSSGDRVFATPYAKKLARESGVDIGAVVGSGPAGRILAADVAATPSSLALAHTAAYTDIELSNMRKTIAKRLLHSKQTVPHYSLTVKIRMDELLRVRKQLNVTLVERGRTEQKLSVNDFVVKASALACMRVPTVNSAWMETHIRQYHSVDISVAVATEDGLITPIIPSAETKLLTQINREVTDLAMRARVNQLQPHEFQGGTFTVSNLGMYGIEHFTAIINPPQSCILAVGCVFTEIVSGSEGGIEPAKMMRVTLMCDHRVVDGAVGAQWLRHFKEILEQPHMMLL